MCARNIINNEEGELKESYTIAQGNVWEVNAKLRKEMRAFNYDNSSGAGEKGVKSIGLEEVSEI